LTRAVIQVCLQNMRDYGMGSGRSLHWYQ
jgi:hypothetical protein